MKKSLGSLIGFIVIFSVITASLSAQTEIQAGTVRELDAECQKLGGLVLAQIKKDSGNSKPKVMVGNFSYQGMPVSLGMVFRQNLINYLSVNGGNQISVMANTNAGVSAAGADVVLTGEIIEIGNIFRVYSRLMKTADNSFAFAWQTDFAKTAYIMQLVNIPGSSGIPMDLFEPDSMDHPVRVSLNGENISRTIHSAEDEDWFVYTGDSDAYILFYAAGTRDFDSLMTLYNSNGREIASNDDYGDSYDAGIIRHVPSGETVYIKVYGYDGETGVYSFSAKTIELEDQQMEPNDTMELAYLITPGPNPIKGFFMASEDVDWYKVTVPPEDRTLLVYTEGSLDTYITIYDETGEVIAENDDGGSSYNARLSFVVSGGTYFIEVTEIDGSTGPYTLHIRLQDALKSDSFEPDNSMAEAKEIRIGSPQSRTFSDSGDIDWVWFTVSARGTYSISAVGDNQELDTYIELYNQDGDLIDEDDDGGSGYDARLEVELTPGKYFIAVETLDTIHSPEGYTLSVTR